MKINIPKIIKIKQTFLKKRQTWYFVGLYCGQAHVLDYCIVAEI